MVEVSFGPILILSRSTVYYEMSNCSHATIVHDFVMKFGLVFTMISSADCQLVVCCGVITAQCHCISRNAIQNIVIQALQNPYFIILWS